MAAIAAGLAIYNRGQVDERSLHRGGEFGVLVCAPYGMEFKTLKCADFPTLRALAQSREIEPLRGQPEELTTCTWPPTIWISRADWDSPNLERNIDVNCGSKTVPLILQPLPIRPGDRVFVDFGRKATVVPNHVNPDRTMAQALRPNTETSLK